MQAFNKKYKVLSRILPKTKFSKPLLYRINGLSLLLYKQKNLHYASIKQSFRSGSFRNNRY